MCIEALRQRDKLPQPFNAQLHTGCLGRTRLACRRRNQKRALANMLDLDRGRTIAYPAAQHHEAASKERMAGITNRDLRRAGIISLI